MQHLIGKYNLVPHPEGGYYREVYRSNQCVKSPVNEQTRNAVTHICFLLLKGQVSRFHKVLHDEIWNFYEGSPLRLVKFNGEKIDEIIIGQNSESYVEVIPGGCFQAAETTGEYSLVGCTVAPGFDFADFSFLNNPDLISRLQEKYPNYKKFL